MAVKADRVMKATCSGLGDEIAIFKRLRWPRAQRHDHHRSPKQAAGALGSGVGRKRGIGKKMRGSWLFDVPVDELGNL